MVHMVPEKRRRLPDMGRGTILGMAGGALSSIAPVGHARCKQEEPNEDSPSRRSLMRILQAGGA